MKSKEDLLSGLRIDKVRKLNMEHLNLRELKDFDWNFDNIDKSKPKEHTEHDEHKRDDKYVE